MITGIEIRDSIILALDAIRSNKFRSGLTILGVLIGVGAVIGMASIIAGMEKQVMTDIENLGSNILYVTRFAPGVDRDRMTEEERNRPHITFEAAEAIRDYCPSVSGVAPRNYYTAPGGNIAKYKNNQANRPSLFGTLPDFVNVENREMHKGRFFNESELDRRAMVGVIGADIAEALFPHEDPIEKSIRVNSRQFRVIGVLERKDPFLGRSDNNFIIIPYSTFEKIHPWEEALFLQVSAASTALIPQAIDEITTVMRRLRGVPYDKDDNFAVWTQESLKDRLNNITNVIYIAMIVISSVGLLVGGVGVMNIMLVSVTERTREIGIRKAIGAKRMNILIQFLTEAMTLSASGGIMGVICGILLAFILKLIVSVPFTVSIVWMVIGFTVSVTVGLVAGLYPAYRAVKVDPIISLRYE